MKPQLWIRNPGGISRRNGDRHTHSKQHYALSGNFPSADRLRVGKRTNKAATSTTPVTVPQYAIDEAVKGNRLFKAAGMKNIMRCVAQNTNQETCVYVEMCDGSAQIRVAARTRRGAMCFRGEITMGPHEDPKSPGWEGRLMDKVELFIRTYHEGQQAA